MKLRERIGSWVAGRPLQQRASPIPITPEYSTSFSGMGEDPTKRILLGERQGIPELAQRAIANRVASINWQTKRTVRTDAETTEDEILDDHPLTRLLENPHPDFTGQQVFRLLAEAIVAVGEGYWYLVTNSFNRPATLQPFQVGTTWPIIRNGVVQGYGQRDGKGAQITLRREDVVRFWWPDLESLYGSRGYFGPNWVYNDSLKFQGEHMRSHWQNDATPKVILKAVEEWAEKPDQSNWNRFTQAWRQEMHGRKGSKRGLPSRIPSGWDVVMVAAQSGADVAPLLEWLQQEQLINFGVPNAILGKVVSGDRSSAETTSWIFDLYTVTPIVDMIRDTINNNLVSRFAPDLFVDYEPFVAPDKEFELKRDVALVEAKIVSPDEVRTDGGRDEAPWGKYPPGTFGDQPYTGEATDNPFTTDVDESGGAPPTDETDEDEPEEERKRLPVSRASMLKHFEPARQWTWRRQQEKRWERRMNERVLQVFTAQQSMTTEALRALQQRAEGDELFDDAAWGALWERIVEPVRRRAYVDAGQQTARMLGGFDFELTQTVVQELRRQGADLVTYANRTTLTALREQLVEGAQAGESIDKLERRIDAVFLGRRSNSRTIARTEILRATEDAQIQSFQQSGVVERKRWNSSRDGAVRDSHIESYIPVVPTSQPFVLPDGERGMYPGDSSFSAGNSINCRCFVTPVFQGEI